MESPKSDLKIGSAEFGVLKLSECCENPSLCRFEAGEMFYIIRTLTPVGIRIGNRDFELSAGKLVFIGPRYQLTIRHMADVSGYLFYFNADFYERSKTDTQILNSALFFGKSPLVQIADQRRPISAFKEQIIDRLQRSLLLSNNDHLIAHHCVESLLLDGYQSMGINQDGRTEPGDADCLVVNRFYILVHTHYREHSTVRFYADQLHLTPRKLTQCCRVATGKCAKHIISGIITKEAVRYLRHTDLSISQIAYEMGFTDESNFRNFIKRETGSIPRFYRKGTPPVQVISTYATF